MPVDIDTLRKILETDDSDTTIRFALGQKLLEEDGTPPALVEASRHLAFVKDNDPNNVVAWYLLAQIHAKQNRTDNALTVLKAALARIEQSPDIDGTDLAPQIEALIDELE